ncbi:MAG: LmbE family protein, partial [Limisphaerales bacterium]
PADPAASVPDLLNIKTRLAKLAPSPVLQEKNRLLDRIVRQCLGLKIETTLSRAEAVPGETLSLHEIASVTSGSVPVRWVAVRYPSLGTETAIGMDLAPGQPAARDSTEALPAGTPLTQPYWLREDRSQGMFSVRNPELIGRPENPSVMPLEQVFKVGDQTLVFPDEPVQIARDSGQDSARRLDAISPVSLKFTSQVGLFAPKATREVTVELTAARPDLNGDLRLNAPKGWEVSPPRRSFNLALAGAHDRLTFSVTAPSQATTATIAAQAQISGKVYDNEQVRIDYPHIPSQLLQPPARLRAVCLDLAVRGHRVGYLPGAGDSVAEALKAMGYSVTTLTGSDLTRERLKGFDAVVIGVRAFNVRADLGPNTDALFGYVEAGGNLIEQYNRPNGLKTERFAPYDLHISSERVTDETAPVTFLVPDHPALNTPNKIAAADFEGWIQEQGIYYPDRWDDHFTPLLASHDPGEESLKGGLLVAPYGKGYFVYTGLVFFRQLPAGVPGAYRLFANLVSLGK